MPIHHHTVNLTSPQSPKPKARPLVLAIGNLDGVHLGHQALVRRTVALASSAGQRAAVLTFAPHPREYFNPNLKPLALMRPASKIKVLEQMGVERVIFAQFDHALATMEAEAFIEDFCVGTLGAHHIVTGENFHFGRHRRGDVALLERTMRGLHLGYSCVEPVLSPPRLRGGLGGGLCEGETSAPRIDTASQAHVQQNDSLAYSGESPPLAPPASGVGNIISSSRIRQALSGGNVVAATELLGRPYALEGRVGHGDKRGRELGFPTANIAMHGLYLPAFGVYAVRIKVDGQWLSGVANLGIRPTFAGETPRLEVHMFDWQGDVYGQRLEVQLLHYIRPEKKFEDKEMLIGQLHRDVLKARELLVVGH